MRQGFLAGNQRTLRPASFRPRRSARFGRAGAHRGAVPGAFPGVRPFDWEGAAA